MDSNSTKRILEELKSDQKNYEQQGRPYLKKIESEEIKKMMEYWKNIADEQGNSIETLVRVLWDEMGKAEGYEFTKEKIEHGIRIRCTHCPLAAIARQYGFEHIGFHKYCMSDYGIVKGFNPKIRFTRTRTRMQGRDYCNHTYEMI